MSTLNQIYFKTKNTPISVFGYFIIRKQNIQKRGKNKKLIEEFFLKLILNIVIFLCFKKSISVGRNSCPVMKPWQPKQFFRVVSKKDQIYYYHRNFLLFSGVFYGVFFAVLFPAGCLGWDLGLN